MTIAVIFDEQGLIAITVSGASSKALATDPAFNPKGHTQVILDARVYRACTDQRSLHRACVEASDKGLPPAIHAELQRMDQVEADRVEREKDQTLDPGVSPAIRSAGP
jgi:hypothetical protein